MNDWKAPKFVELTFVARLPRHRWRPNEMVTSCTMGAPASVRAAAICSAVMRFSVPSSRISPMGSWLPVSTTGLARPGSMNESAEAV